MARVVQSEIFQNKRATVRGFPLFSSQPVGTDTPVPFAQFCFDRRMGPVIFPPFPLFVFERWSSAVACFLSYLFVQNGIFACASDARTLAGFSSNTSRFLCQKQNKNFVMAHQPSEKFPKKTVSEFLDSFQGLDGDRRTVRAMRSQTRLCGWKTFPFDPECFQNFLPEILSK